MEPSEELLRGLLGAAPDALVAVGANGEVVFANNQAERLFGWTRQELVGRPVEDLVPERFAAHHVALRAGYVARPTTRPMGGGLDLRARRRDGSEFPAEISLSAFTTAEGTIVAAAIRDVTDRIELEGERQRRALIAQREQSHRLESLGELAGGVAHDFNNLLGVILNYSTLVARRVTDPVAVADLAEIRAAAERAAGLTHQLLTFARRDVADRRPVDINDIVRGVASMLDRTLGEHVDLRLDLSGRPIVALADRHQLEQIVLNLAINARDAMPGGGRLTISTDHVPRDPARADSDHVVLRVSDTGRGMTREVQARAFDPFFTTKPRGQGTGLGLATVYGIVHQSGGTVAIDSTVGAGTTVTVTLRGTRDAVAAGGPDPELARGGDERILLVEDEPALRVATSRMLRDHGYDVVVATDGLEALAFIDADPGPIAMVLTDVVMPRMRGDQLAAALSEHAPRIPVVFMSGYDSGEVPLTGRLLTKPVAEDELLRAIRDVLDG